jgi:hypothetical protein
LDGDHPLIEDEDAFTPYSLQINKHLGGKKADYFRFCSDRGIKGMEPKALTTWIVFEP